MPKVASASEAIKAMSESADPQKLSGLDAVLLFDLSGEGGGRWTVTVTGGQISVADGAVDSPTMTLIMAAEDFVAMINGDLNAMAAFMQGKIKIEGDMSIAMRLQALFS